jgi:hypothetical protein
MRSGSAAMPCRMSLAPRRAWQETGAASARCAGPPCRAAERMRAIAIAGTVDERIIAKSRSAVGWAKLRLTHRAWSAFAHAVGRNRGKRRGGSYLVMAGLVPAISMIGALCPPDRDRRDKPGDDENGVPQVLPLLRSDLLSPCRRTIFPRGQNRRRGRCSSFSRASDSAHPCKPLVQHVQHQVRHHQAG